MSRFRLTRQRLVGFSILAISAILLGVIGRFLLVRRQYLRQKAAFYEYRSKVIENLFLNHSTSRTAEFDEEYMARSAVTARAYRQAAKLPFLPEPDEPSYGR